MKYAVIGLGAISPFFLDAVERSPGATLVAVCDLDATKLAPFTDRGVASFTSHTELLAAGLCDAVIVTLPNDVHADVTIAALDAGLAVCCEKPLAITTADATRMTEAAVRSGKTLFTAFHRRYNRNLVELRDKLTANHVGRVVVRYHENITEHTAGEGWYLDPSRCGGGCVIDNGPNALDMARLLVGDLILTDATLGDVRSGAEFSAELDLRSASGIPVRVELNWALPTGEVKDVTVEFTDGTTAHADVLAGFHGFKASLSHEYDAILTAFASAIAEGRTYRDPGPSLVALVEQAYRTAAIGTAAATGCRNALANDTTTPPPAANGRS